MSLPGFRELLRAGQVGAVLSTEVGVASVRWALLRWTRRRDPARSDPARSDAAWSETAWSDAAADAVASGFERLGPTFVKVGQLMASTAEVFPRPLAAACMRLLDDVAPVPAQQIRELVEADLGAPVSELFAAFEDRPLASGSVAQVHACVLPDGREAVLKVQRPGIRERMLMDLRLAYRTAAIVERFRPRVRTANATGVVRDLHAVTLVELDSLAEARNQARMRECVHAFGDNENVMVPEIYWRWCGPRVICMERVYGGPIDRVAPVRFDEAERIELVRSVVKVWLEAVTVHGLFHGDVHAGNLWVLDDGRLAMLDFGIVGELPPDWRVAIRDLFCASAIDGDFGKVARSLRAVGFGAQLDVSDETMGAQLGMVLAPLLSLRLAEMNLSELIDAMLEMGREWGAVGPEELILFGKQLGYFERYAVALAPDWVLGADPLLLRNIARLAASDSDEVTGTGPAHPCR